MIKGWKESLWYSVPERLSTHVTVGTIVQVPLQTRLTYAMVTEVAATLPYEVTFNIRELSDVALLPPDGRFDAFLKKIADFYFMQPVRLYRRLLGFLEEAQEDIATVSAPHDEVILKTSSLTDEQQCAVDAIMPAVLQPVFKPILLQGVTGSGKTEVYKRLIETTIKQGRTVLFMLPEVSLCARFEHILRHQLSADIAIFRFDSGTTVKHRRALWNYLSTSNPCLILGVHLPVLLPISNLGLIIVDEEHEDSFVEKRHPRLHSREIAVWRAQEYGVPIVLGSATPSLASLYRVQTKGWMHLKLTKRFVGTLPPVNVVSLKKDKRRPQFWLTPRLECAIEERLARREQVIIFLNRRGHSFFVQCGICGEIFECRNCSVSLTLHQGGYADLDGGGVERAVLNCHYCNFSQPLPTACPHCQAPDKKFIKKGIGTQRLVSLLQERFPLAKIARVDKSVGVATSGIFESFYRGEIDILVGTQTVTKGYHFPRVTLVGVIWGDLDLNFPSYDARESALQQLIQVAGRAGRSALPGAEVIIQTLADNPVFLFVCEDRYPEFCQQELAVRKEMLYPPCGRLMQIELFDRDATIIDAEARQLVADLEASNQDQRVIILGPGKPMIHRIKNVEIRQILLKSSSFAWGRSLLSRVNLRRFRSSITINPIL